MAMTILFVELIIMVLLHFAQFLLPSVFPESIWWIIDPLMLVLILAPILVNFFLQPMRVKQQELERQLDELSRFQKLTVGRELRIKELTEENSDLKTQLLIRSGQEPSP